VQDSDFGRHWDRIAKVSRIEWARGIIADYRSKANDYSLEIERHQYELGRLDERIGDSPR
jgi:hypothetical protein